MKYDPAIHHRHTLRLRGYDYSRNAACFVTICAQNRDCLFGDIVAGAMILNDAGRMVQSVWDGISTHYSGVEIDAFVIMPNHIHGIIIIVGAGPCACPKTGRPRGGAPTTTASLSLPDVVHRFKTLTTKRYTDGVKQCGWPPYPGRVWQRNYWEHVIRNKNELYRIRKYIIENPTKWDLDQDNQHRCRLASAPFPNAHGFKVFIH